MKQTEFQHLMNRAGFGATLDQLRNCGSKTRSEVVDELFADSEDGDDITAVKRLEVEDIMNDLKESDADAKKALRKMLYERGVELNCAWLRRMINGKAELLEKMTFFWHGHFACRDDNPVLLQSLNNAMRDNALGKFKDMLLTVAQSPAMLNFLNNQQNKKGAPNENFAREVMELFTLGRGNYTEHDIKEAARAFTGWSFDKETQNFYFRQHQHDYDEKEFMGKRGNFDGADILDVILYKEDCAKFIAGKIYQFFVNDERDEKIIAGMAHQLYMSDYDMEALMKHIFLADWFYDDKNIGARIKSPVELIAGATRLLQVEFGNDDSLVYVQKILGQTLFLPPNVAGWPGGRRWIDSTSLIFRMDLGRKLIESATLNEKLKADDDRDPNMILQKEKEQKKKGKLNELDSRINWTELEKYFDAPTDAQLFEQVNSALLVTGKVDYDDVIITRGTMGADADHGGTGKLKSITAYLMSKPEFQLC